MASSTATPMNVNGSAGSTPKSKLDIHRVTTRAATTGVVTCLEF